MRRVVVTALVVLAAVPAVVAGGQVNAAVTNVSVAPTTPAPGESVTFTTTIRNLDASGEPMDIQAVAIRRVDGNSIDELTRVSNLGTLAPGTSVELPLSHTFDSAGTKDLRVYVYGENSEDGKNLDLRYPVTLTVEERHPQVDVNTEEAVAGVESAGTVTVANGLDTPVSNVEVSVDGTGVETRDDRSVFASLDEGETVTANFSFRPESSGLHELQTTVSYTLPSGTERTVTQNRTLETESAGGSVVLEPRQTGSGSDQTLIVDVANEGTTPAENVVVTGVSDNATVSQATVGTVAPGATEQVSLNTTLGAESADVVVTADYESDSTQRTAAMRTTLYTTPGSITLTGIDVTEDNGVLRLTGSTANNGTTTAKSVEVSVQSTENVEPAPPNRDFFVGEVPGSSFSSFDLTARVGGNASTIPVEVSYIVDGTHRNQTFSVPLGGANAGEQASDSAQAGLGTGLLAVGGLAAVAVLVVAGILVRRYRRDDDVEI